MNDEAKATFSYFKHDAEIGIIGRGATVEQAFEGAAAGMFAIMAGSGNAVVTRHIELEFVEPDVERALVTWLNSLLVAARAQDAALFTFHVERGPNGQWHGSAEGCAMRHAHELGVEVKGVTFDDAAVHTDSGGAEARCVVDV